MIRMLIVDDHAVVRRGIRALLESQPEWRVCAEAKDGREAVRKVDALKPEVAILDVGMPGLNGAEALRQIRKASPSTAVVIFTMHDSEELAAELLRAGACGYLLKSEVDEDLIPAVKAAIKHQPYLTATIGTMVLRDYLAPGALRRSTDPGLTPREHEILQLAAEGETAKEIASKLGIATETARTHRKNIMQKLGLHSTAALVHYAVRNRIVVS
jgi:DNA-binding NarL/FixJ family response regulator